MQLCIRRIWIVHPDRTKAPPLRNLSIARELTLASFGICGEVQDHCEWPRKHRKLEYGIVLRVSGLGLGKEVRPASFTCKKRNTANE